MDFPETLPEEWASCVKHFLQERRAGSEATYKQYHCVLRHFFASTGKHPARIGKADVLSFLSAPCHGNFHRGKEPSANHFNVMRSAISSLYRFASTYTLSSLDGAPQPLFTGINPASGIKRRKPDVEPRGMSKAEIECFFKAIDREASPLEARDYCIFYLYFVLALRREELLRLRWSDIQPWTFENCRRGWRYRLVSSKGHPEPCYAEFPGTCMSVLLDYLEKSGRLASIKGEDPLFVAMEGNGTKPLHSNSVEARLRFYLRKAGLNEHITLHSFRHASAQSRYAQGASLLSIQRVLRHKSLAVTQVYLERLNGQADDEAKLIEFAL